MKKNILLFVLTLLSTLTTSAYDAEIDGIYYNLDFNTWPNRATVTSGDTKYTGRVAIPATVTYEDKTYSVTEIGNSAFYRCTGLTSIAIPSSVTNIRDRAFEDCLGLTSVHITDIAAWCNIRFYSNPLSRAGHFFRW